MYLHLGRDVMVPFRDIVAIFDLDNTTASYRTRRFLELAQARGQVVDVWEDLPKSLVLCARNGEQTVYISQLAAATLLGRAESSLF